MRVDGRPRRLDRARHDRTDEHRLELQRDHAARNARDIQQVVDQVHEMLDLPLDHVSRTTTMRLRQLFETQQLHRRADWRERIPQLVGKHREEFVLAMVRLLERLRRGFERRGSFSHPSLELRVQSLQRAGLAKQLREHAHLGPQNLRNHRHGYVVHGAALVPTQTIQVGHQNRRHEDD